MKKYLSFLLCLYVSAVFATDVKISQLPLATASSTGVNDSFPYVNATTGTTERVTLWDLINLPPFTTTYAKLANPTFTGTVTATTFSGALTGVASGNTAYTPNNFGVVLSSSTNTMNVLAPDSSTLKVLFSGGSSANAAWGILPGAYYWTGYYPASASNYWSSTNTSIGDFTVVGTIPTPTALQTANWNSVSKATSNLPGVNFSAPKTGVINVSVSFCYYPVQITTNTTFELTFLESTTATTLALYSGGNTFSASASEPSCYPVRLEGMMSVTASTTYNFKIQEYHTNAGTSYLGNTNGNGSELSFVFKYIN